MYENADFTGRGEQKAPQPGESLVAAGPIPEAACATLILVHGRGAMAKGMISIYKQLGVESVAALAPQAYANSWYPNSFLASIESNQPFLDLGLERLELLVRGLEARGVDSHRVALLGFSQGACLLCEFVARHPRRYGAVMALTGGLIGPPGTPRDYTGSLEETPIFLGTSDPDPHVPFERVKETREVFDRMGARVKLRRYPGMAHTICEEELEVCRVLLEATVSQAKGRERLT